MSDYWEQFQERVQRDLGLDPEQAQEAVEAHLRLYTAQRWGQNHPELGGDQAQYNGDIIQGVLDEHGWPFNVENIDAAYLLAKERGLLKESPVQPASGQPGQPANAGVITPMYAKPVNTSAGMGYRNLSEAEFLQTCSSEEMERYIREKHPTNTFSGK